MSFHPYAARIVQTLLDVARDEQPVFQGVISFDRSGAGAESLRTASGRLVWVDRSGAASPVGAPVKSYMHPRLGRLAAPPAR